VGRKITEVEASTRTGMVGEGEAAGALIVITPQPTTDQLRTTITGRELRTSRSITTNNKGMYLNHAHFQTLRLSFDSSFLSFGFQSLKIIQFHVFNFVYFEFLL